MARRAPRFRVGGASELSYWLTSGSFPPPGAPYDVRLLRARPRRARLFRRRLDRLRDHHRMDRPRPGWPPRADGRLPRDLDAADARAPEPHRRHPPDGVAAERHG